MEVTKIKKFKSSTKKQLKECILFDKDKNIIFSGVYHDIPLKDNVIIEKSIELFNDPNPCFIHRGAIMVRMCCEIEHECQSIEMSSIPPITQSYINLDHAVYYCVQS